LLKALASVSRAELAIQFQPISNPDGRQHTPGGMFPKSCHDRLCASRPLIFTRLCQPLRPSALQAGTDQHQIGSARSQQRDYERGMQSISGCSKGRLHDGENIRRF
jgi:hypothetical protein